MALNHAIEVRILDEVHTPDRYWNCHEGLSEKLIMRVSFRNIFKPALILPAHENAAKQFERPRAGQNIKAGCMVDERAVMEISPGSIRIHECPTCMGDMFTFDAVALNIEGVAFVGTIRRCYTCEGT